MKSSISLVGPACVKVRRFLAAGSTLRSVLAQPNMRSFVNGVPLQGGPLRVITWFITPITRVIAPVT